MCVLSVVEPCRTFSLRGVLSDLHATRAYRLPEQCSPRPGRNVLRCTPMKRPPLFCLFVLLCASALSSADDHGRLAIDPKGTLAARAQVARFRPRVEAARTAASFEDTVDEMLAERPTIKPEATSQRAVVISAHPLATAAGLEALRRGGNVVDAIVAVSLALGVVEEDASGIGGEGMMLIHRVSDAKTVAIDFKDQVPMEGVLRNPKILDGDRLVASGPAAVNIPGVVAGMDLAYRKYGSGKIAWMDLIEPAIRAATDGFVLDEALPSSVREGQRLLKRYDAAAKMSRSQQAGGLQP